MKIIAIPSARCSGRRLFFCAALLLSGCGGGGEEKLSGEPAPTMLASGTTVLQIAIPALPEAVAQQAVQPFFNVAPVLLDAPDPVDDAGGTGHERVHRHRMSGEFDGLATRRLTVQAMESARRHMGRREARALAAGSTDAVLAPMAAGSVIATYTPAQIRAAYALPALPSMVGALTSAQAAQLGAGQTIYIVDAMHDPNVGAELAAFNLRFGLPACTTRTLTPNASLPLAAAGVGGCELLIAYTTAGGAMTGVQPAYEPGWATEIALDVQWAHATAPLARIILIEAPDATVNSLLGSVRLANAMGPGVVSMSFGAIEGNWTASQDGAFSVAGMSYLAATGDSGAAVAWPSVSPNVLAVGGTTLSYSGAGARNEVSWSGTGGGVSLYTPTPAYQTNAVPGMGTAARRTVADVAFNADPASGQYVAVISPTSGAMSWLSVGGTSLSTPQWAGLIAIANAQRALLAKPALGAVHALLYGSIASVPGNYASVFADITSGSDGSCSTCTAKIGYDHLSGLGTPNVASLLTAFSGMAAAAIAPVVTSAGISGMAGKALSFTVSVAAPNPVTYALGGAPAGMTINGLGAVAWAVPVLGNYPVTVVARDGKTGLSGQGIYSVSIAAQPAPVVASSSIQGKAGVALSFSVAVTAPNPVTYALSGAPSGMTISSVGVVSWAKPVSGSYAVTVTARDGKTGLNGKGICTVGIAAQPAPVVASASILGRVGTALSFAVAVAAPNPVTYTLGGAPAGMAISSMGVLKWAKPVSGSYAVTVTAKDGRTGLSGQGRLAVQIGVAGPVIKAPALTGVAGKLLTGTISIVDPGATMLSVAISGVPMGMTFAVLDTSIIVFWARPVAGKYSLNISVIDSANLKAQATMPITVQ
jgi:hypothetical protein